MTFRTCNHEDRILAAVRTGVRTGELSPEQRAHLASCPSCLAAVEAEHAMSALAEPLVQAARRRLPPPEVILLRAKLRARREAAERSLRPLEIWLRFAAVAVAMGLALGLSVSGSLFGALASGPAQLHPSRLLFAVGLAALAVLPFARRIRPFA